VKGRVVTHTGGIPVGNGGENGGIPGGGDPPGGNGGGGKIAVVGGIAMGGATYV